MKTRDIKNLKQKTIDQLNKDLAMKRTEIIRISLERKVKPNKNYRLISVLKDDVARILTTINELKLKENLKK